MEFNEKEFIRKLTENANKQKTIGEVLLDFLGIDGMELISETEVNIDAPDCTLFEGGLESIKRLKDECSIYLKENNTDDSYVKNYVMAHATTFPENPSSFCRLPIEKTDWILLSSYYRVADKLKNNYMK
jgi:hypothetical protein